MRFFAARRETVAKAGLRDGLRALYKVPVDMPDEFLKAFARLDSKHTRDQLQPVKCGERDQTA